jgi:AraC-like DNA-binding protein
MGKEANMPKASNIAVSELAFPLGQAGESSEKTKIRLTRIQNNVIPYQGPSVQILGTVSAFITQRLSQIILEPTGCPDWRVLRFQRFVDNECGKIGRSVEEICRHLGLGISGCRLARLFGRCLRVTVREYSKRKRLCLSVELLKDPTLSVKEIASELGYHTPWDFQRQFKQLFLLTPTEFRTLFETEVYFGQNKTVSPDQSLGPTCLRRAPAT